MQILKQLKIFILPLVLPLALFFGVFIFRSGLCSDETFRSEDNLMSKQNTENSPSVLFWDDLDLIGKKISKVTITGLKRAKETYIRRLISISEGDTLEKGKVDDSLDNIRNTRIMREATAQGIILEDGTVEIIFQMEELWTTIPVILFAAGGGSLLILAGFVESNIFGYGGQGYATYQARDGTQTWITSLKQPDLFQTNLLLNSDFRFEEIKNEIRDFKSERYVFGGYTALEKSLSSSLSKPFEFYNPELPNFARQITLGVGLKYAKWESSENLLSEEVIETNRRLNFTLPKSTERIIPYWDITLGKVNYNKNLAVGFSVNYKYSLGFSLNKKDSGINFQEHLLKLRIFLPLPHQVQLASRMEYQNRKSNNILDEDMLGGLFHVRGLPNDIFRGHKLWMLNLEFRKILAEFNLFEIQGVAFTDLGNTSASKTYTNTPYLEFRKPKNISQSIGFGSRILFPEVSELSIRTDYGWVISPFYASGISLGLVQFIR
jgi:outer membrane protein assembly factor BamA